MYAEYSHSQAALDLSLVAGEELGRQTVVGDGAGQEVAQDDRRLRAVQHQVRQRGQQALKTWHKQTQSSTAQQTDQHGMELCS